MTWFPPTFDVWRFALLTVGDVADLDFCFRKETRDEISRSRMCFIRSCSSDEPPDKCEIERIILRAISSSEHR